MRTHHLRTGLAGLVCCVAVLAGCSPLKYRLAADKTANTIIEQKQEEWLGRTEPIVVESPAETFRRKLLVSQGLQYSGPASLGVKDLEPIEHWPKDNYLDQQEGAQDPVPPWQEGEPIVLTLIDALYVAALNSREYQSAKENVFETALNLDMARDEFRASFATLIQGMIRQDRSGEDTVGVVDSRSGAITSGISKKFKNGAELASHVSFDLLRISRPDSSTTKGIFFDASLSVPLLRGAGKHIAAEPLTQAERDVVYAIYEFERFKRTFAVRVASDYLSVLQQMDSVVNAEENYKGLIASARRARRMADAGKLDEIQVDQARQDELKARSSWVNAIFSYEQSLDDFKVQLGLPADSAVDLDRSELEKIDEVFQSVIQLVGGGVDASQSIPPADAPIVLEYPSQKNAGPLELPEETAIRLALENRLDLQTALGAVDDAQRAVVVAADALRAELTLLGTAATGERNDINGPASLDFSEGIYTGLLTLDLPLERTKESIAYRKSLIDLEQAVRNVQESEDEIKLAVRGKLRDMIRAREGLQIQALSVDLAKKQVKSSDLFFQAGRIEIRDLLDAQESLLSAQNSFTGAIVDYRIAELELQRDIGLLEVNEKGMWTEFVPPEEQNETSQQ